MADAVDLGARPVDRLWGRIVVDADEDFPYRANLAHPTANRIFRVMAEGDVEGLEDVARLVADVPWEDVFALDQSFAGDCVRVGEHPFTSVDVGRAVGDGVCARFRQATGGAARPRVDLASPDVNVLVHLRQEHAYVCLDTTGAPLHHRPWHVYQPKAPLPATLASALVRRARWREGLLLDPMCGSGTIPIEADFRARRRAVNLPRAGFAVERLKLHDPERLKRARDQLACAAEDERPPILGNEWWEKAAEGARMNVRSAGAEIDIVASDVNDLPRPEGLRTVIVNPPWGRRLATREAGDRVGAQLRAKLLEWAKEGPYDALVVVGNGRFQRHKPQPETASDVLVGGVTARVLTYRF